MTTVGAIDGDRGGATSVEMALLWGVLLLLILAVVQIGLLGYAGQLALTAAQDGLRSGSVYSADPASVDVAESARRDARDFLTRSAGTVLSDVDVAASVDGQGLLRVRVTGTALSLVPGVPLSVEREAVGAPERPAP